MESTKDTTRQIEKIFPDYFERFSLPEGAHEEKIKVYRACRSGKCDKLSFLPTFEEKGFRTLTSENELDPGEYSLSTFEKPNHIKRWADMTSDMQVPYKIAIGYTNPVHGVVQRTSERKAKSRSHVDWWLYKDAEPYREFELIPDFTAHLQAYIEKRDDRNE